MRLIAFIITALILLNSCSHKIQNQKKKTAESMQLETVETVSTANESTATNDYQKPNFSEFDSELNEIPPNGTYRFDIAFAEWQGKSMGEKVTVIINGDSIKIVYTGGGQLTLTEKGEVIDQGLIMKHKSGEWIIGTNKNDKEIDEVGGCTDGPAIIDFKNKKYWMC